MICFQIQLLYQRPSVSPSGWLELQYLSIRFLFSCQSWGMFLLQGWVVDSSTKGKLWHQSYCLIKNNLQFRPPLCPWRGNGNELPCCLSTKKLRPAFPLPTRAPPPDNLPCFSLPLKIIKTSPLVFFFPPFKNNRKCFKRGMKCFWPPRYLAR